MAPQKPCFDILWTQIIENKKPLCCKPKIGPKIMFLFLVCFHGNINDIVKK